MLPILLIAALPAPAQDFELPERAAARTELVVDPVVVPLDLASGWPVVEVRFGDAGPFPMVLDTGAMGVALDADLADELGLEPVGETRMGDPTDPTKNRVDVVVVESLAIGDAWFEDVQAVAWDRPPALRRPGLRGIVGLPLFADCTFTVDYPGAELRITRRALPEPGTDGVVELRKDAMGVVLLPVEVAGHRFDAHVDSGNSASLILPVAAEPDIPVVEGSRKTGHGRRASGDVTFTVARLDGSLRVGSLTLENPEVRFDPGLPHANVGYSLLRHFALTIDQPSGRMRVTGASSKPTEPDAKPKAAPAGAPARKGSFGIQVAFDGSPEIRIASVVPGSLADGAGVRAGDVLRAIDGRPVTHGAIEPLSDAVASGRPFAVELEREGERLTLAAGGELPPEAAAFDPEAVLDRMLGTYRIEARVFRTPGGEPELGTGEATFQRSPGGRYVHEHFVLRFGGQELPGDAFLVWRPLAERFELSQIDEFKPLTLWLTGSWDAPAERLRFRNVAASRVGPLDHELHWEYRFEPGGVLVKEMAVPDASGQPVLRSDYRYVPLR